MVIYGKQNRDILGGGDFNCNNSPYKFNSTPTEIYINNELKSYDNYYNEIRDNINNNITFRWNYSPFR